jgi:hypothetical protein
VPDVAQKVKWENDYRTTLQTTQQSGSVRRYAPVIHKTVAQKAAHRRLRWLASPLRRHARFDEAGGDNSIPQAVDAAVHVEVHVSVIAPINLGSHGSRRIAVRHAMVIDPVLLVPFFCAVLASVWIAATLAKGWLATSICFLALLPAVNAYVVAGAAYVVMLFAGGSLSTEHGDKMRRRAVCAAPPRAEVTDFHPDGGGKPQLLFLRDLANTKRRRALRVWRAVPVRDLASDG